MAVGVINWNVQQDGDDDNGGGYLKGGATTDYSLQAAAALSLADLACASNTTLTSATGGFTAAMVGNIVHIISGTNDVPGWYEIKTYVSSNEVTIDRTCATGGNMSDGVGKVGGALATIGGLGAVLASSENARTVGSRGWLKYSATPTEVTTNTANVATGYFNQDAAWNLPFAVLGYKTTQGDNPTGADRPQINVNSAGTIASVFDVDETSDEYSCIIAHIIVNNSGAGALSAACIGSGGYTLAVALNCKAIGASTGFSTVTCIACESVSCTTGFGGNANAKLLYKCVAASCTTGFTNAIAAVNCIAHSGTLGFSGILSTFVNCVAANNSGDGFDKESTHGSVFINCVSTNNAWGFDLDTNFVALWNCFTDANSSGTVDLTLIDFLGGPAGAANNTELDATPWVDGGDDNYSLDAGATGGALLRAAGIKLPSGFSVDAPDIGAAQHADLTPAEIAAAMWDDDTSPDRTVTA